MKWFKITRIKEKIEGEIEDEIIKMQEKTIYESKLIHIIGPSASGKTTAFKAFFEKILGIRGATGILVQVDAKLLTDLLISHVNQ